MNHRSLTLVVHGESGAGKSWLADSAPAPRLVFDVEGGVRFTSSAKVAWDPRTQPPVPDGTWDTAVVTTVDLDEIRRAFAWLNQGQHPFRSVVIDSLSEAQKRHIDSIAGTKQLTQQDWGDVGRTIDSMVRGFRDLTMNQKHPVEVVVFVCGSKEKGTDEHAVVRPALAGAMAEQLGYNVDVMGYLSVAMDGNGELERRIQFVQLDGIAAKDRTGRLGTGMVNPTIPRILDTVYGQKEDA